MVQFVLCITVSPTSIYYPGVYCSDQYVRRKLNIMTLSATVVLFVLAMGFTKSSSVLTKSMIRMPSNSSDSFKNHPSERYLPKPALLVSNPNETDFEIVYPFKPTYNFSFSTAQSKSLNFDNEEYNRMAPVEKDFKIDSSKEKSNLTFSFKNPNDRIEPFGETSSTISPIDLSRKYWTHYNNFSNDFFTRSKFPIDFTASSSPILKQFPQTNILEILQNIFSCFWSSGLVACLQDNFGISSSMGIPYIQSLMGRFPNGAQQDGSLHDEESGVDEEDNSSRNGIFDIGMNGEDEARKRLSKKLQSLVPFLLMLKMTMLPALAVMALVSGKAFLLSLVSLGVAVLAASLPAPFAPLAASKRHEISPQTLPPSAADQAPNRYYYAM